MRAIHIRARGGPDQLAYEDAPIPTVKPGDALIRVYATGITPAELSWAATYQNPDGSDRLPSIPGHEASGVVEDLADGVTDLKVGDEVYGLTDFARDGAAADYAAVRARNLAPKPRTLDHSHAAAVPLSALTAWQALFDHAGLARDQRVLIHGAAGGVGTFAVQLARWRGANVIATASRRDFDFLRKIGAHEIFDYATERFEDKISNVDAVLDTVGGSTLERSWGVLKPGGTLVTLVAPVSAGSGARHGVNAVFFIVQPNRNQLAEITRLVDEGAVQVVVAEILPLIRAREAFERGLQGHVRGKLVLQVAAQSRAA